MYLKGILIITGFLALGNAASVMLGHFIPGSVCGMVLLFIALASKAIKAEDVRPVADFLTKNMSLFFVPASIGIMKQWGLISGSLFGWAGVILISTLLVLLTVGGTQSCLMRLCGKKPASTIKAGSEKITVNDDDSDNGNE